jgi:hypothetical protein
VPQATSRRIVITAYEGISLLDLAGPLGGVPPARPPDHPLACRILVVHRIRLARSVRSQTSESNLFHRSAAQLSREAPVMHDFASADVDSVVCVAAALSDNVSTHRRFWLCDQKLLGPM